MTKKVIENPSEFKEFINGNHQLNILKRPIRNVLLGNGFSLSFREWSERYKKQKLKDFANIKDEDISGLMQIVPEVFFEQLLEQLSEKKFMEFNSNNKKIENIVCPESLLYFIRLESSEVILKIYLEQLKKVRVILTGSRAYNLGLFENIFTLNYDSLSYYEILNYIHTHEKKDDKHIDGFCGDEYVKQDLVRKRLTQAKKRLCFLHGSWMINIDYLNNDKIKKISFKKHFEDSFIEEAFNWSEQKLPLLILEDRWKTKKQLISGCTYLNACFEIMKNSEGDLVTLGCSFRNDEHILEAIHDSKFTTIYVTHLGYEVPRELEKKVKSIVNNKEVIFVPISKNVIWEEKK